MYVYITLYKRLSNNVSLIIVCTVYTVTNFYVKRTEQFRDNENLYMDRFYILVSTQLQGGKVQGVFDT